MKRIIPLLLTSIACASHGQTELKGNPDDLRSFLHPKEQVVTILEQAEKTAYSDKAIIHLVVTTEAKTLSESLSLNNTIREKVGSDLIAKGIQRDDIKNAQFTSTPQYGFFGKKPSTYKVVNRISVTIFEESSLRAVAQVADQYEEVDLSKTTFEHTKKEAFEQQVKEDVLKKVIQQKTFYEKSLGVQLQPIGFRDAKVRERATQGAMAVEGVEEIIVTGMRASLGSSKDYEEEKAEPSFDEVVYQAELSVDYKIINKAN
ncbi:MAG: hypothetical protein B0W54_14775 [Cellvibrio sp. 79]|nr:MAG: hypothetical protein B0W54_14775 [Cellvibrio sp. 79]